MKTKMAAGFVAFLMETVFLTFSMGSSGRDENSKLCQEFLGQLNQCQYARLSYLEEEETGREDFNRRIPHVDVDEDNIDDQILLFRGGSASLIPPDNDSLTLIFVFDRQERLRNRRSGSCCVRSSACS
jgi:hypothetical protein